MLALAAPLAARPAETRRFLTVALAHDRPQLDVLAAAGVPRWDAQDLLRRLQAAGEVGDSGWRAEARAAYQEHIAEPAAASPAPRLLDLLPGQERPREKALAAGVGALADAELVAILLRTGTADEGVAELAHRLVAQHGGLVGLSRLSVERLACEPGLGPAKAAELAAAFELGARLAAAAARERPRLARPEQVAAFIAESLGPLMARLDHEECWCLPLDAQCRLIGSPRPVSRGEVDGTEIGVRAFYRQALAAGATSAIAVHNHPSGDPAPSAADREVTRRLAAAGRTVDLPLVDHLVLGAGGAFASLRCLDPGLFRG